MLKKLKMTTFAAVLGLFGFVLFSAAPVIAGDSFDERYKQCQKTKGLKKKKNCFKELVGDERQAAADHIKFITRSFNDEIKELDKNLKDICSLATQLDDNKYYSSYRLRIDDVCGG